MVHTLYIRMYVQILYNLTLREGNVIQHILSHLPLLSILILSKKKNCFDYNVCILRIEHNINYKMYKNDELSNLSFTHCI